ncbi:MAG TPA: outer membrane lipoprotein-sorting protein [Candidatus Krumholzibacterium sp.]|nr:outer membrane lipoprotein-sorting protein [Candidatus Krumholzibacterium sp.]
MSDKEANGRTKMVMLVAGIIILLSPVRSFAQVPSGDEVLRKVDANLVTDSAKTSSVMVIHTRTATRTIRSTAWSRGRHETLVEYTSPAREKGKKMLRLEDKLWTYTPEPNDRIITISGHLLRQSVMGSDLSYEDMMENDRLLELYTAVVTGDSLIGDRDCWAVTMTAKEEDIAYHSRKVWVDKERWLPLRSERFARSGRLLKTTTLDEVFYQDGRWYPGKMTFKDVLSRGEGTEYIIESIEFDIDIPDHYFTKAALRS